MPRNITVTFEDGTQHVYNNAPDNITPEAVQERAQQEFGKGVMALDGGRSGVLDKLDRAGRDFTAGGVRGVLGTVVGGLRDVGNAVTSAVPADMRPNGVQPMPGSKETRANIDQFMKDKVGADPESGAYGVGNGVGEVGVTMPVGGVVGGTIKALGAKKLGTAVSSGGFSLGERTAPGVVNAVKDAGVRAAGGGINAYTSTAVVDPEDAGKAGAIGAVLPGVVKVAGKAGQMVGQAVSGNMARNAAVRKTVEAVGDDAVPQTIADIQTYYPKGAENIPVSAAAATANPKLAQLEQGSRLRSPDQWYGFDQKQGKAVYDNVQRATGEADQLGQRAADRQANWAANWQAAAANQKPRLWRERMTQFGEDLRQAEMSPEASNPAVRQVLDAINAEMDRLGPNFGLGHLQQMRANLNGKTNPLRANDAFASAPRDNPAIISLKQEMDDILNTATGGKWQKVLEGYAEDSTKLHASKAAQKVRNAFVDGETGRVRGVSLDANGDVPKITEAGLGRAMDSARLPDKSLALSPEADQRLTATLDALRRQNIVQGVKRTGTAGSGSDTVSNGIAAGGTALGLSGSHAPSLLVQGLNLARKVGLGRQDEQLAALLTNPDELAIALERYLRPPAPNRAVSALYQTAPVALTRGGDQ